MIDEFRRVKASEHYESINSVGGQHISEATSNQPSTSSVKQSPVKSNASVSGVLVNNKQVHSYFLVNRFKILLNINLYLLIERQSTA